MPFGTPRDFEGDTGPSGRRTLSTVAISRCHQSPQSGQHDTETETAKFSKLAQLTPRVSKKENYYTHHYFSLVFNFVQLPVRLSLTF
jgi:hypothetical protein